MTVFDHVRLACAEVTLRAKHVTLELDRVAPYALSLPLESLDEPSYDPRYHYQGPPETLVAYVLTLDTINFGSGYFPMMRKRPGLSGYYTVALSLKEWFDTHGPWSAAALSKLTAQDCARVFGQDLKNPAQSELMGLFADALNELGRFLLEHFAGSYVALVTTAEGSAEKLVSMLLNLPMFQDVAPYADFDVPFFKRAQIVVTDLFLAFGGDRWGHFYDLHELTIFADNLVPHVLRVDGLLRYDDRLLKRIAAGKLVRANSRQEVEIRAVALHAVELMVGVLQQAGYPVSARELDYLLWNRGQEPQYKTQPRHRTRSIFY